MTQTPAERLLVLLERLGLESPFKPATAAELAHADAVATLPDPLRTLYARVDLVRFGEVEPFHIADFIEVNRTRARMGELADGIFVASDLADGWFFVDPTDFMGLRVGFVFWVERGALAVDACVPAAESLIDLFERALDGERPWKAAPLGERAVARLVSRLASSRAVEPRAPLDPARLGADERTAVPLRVEPILLQCDGFLLHRSERECFGLDGMTAVPGTEDEEGFPGALWMGKGPGGVRYATTTGTGWRGLPADRLIAIAPGTDPARAAVLGRTADVWSRWISDDEET